MARAKNAFIRSGITRRLDRLLAPSAGLVLSGLEAFGAFLIVSWNEAYEVLTTGERKVRGPVYYQYFNDQGELVAEERLEAEGN